MPLYVPFQVFFYQKWGFFKNTEPVNRKLYYEIKNGGNDSLVAKVEVLEPIRRTATGKAPFNQQQLMLDVLLERCIREVINTDPSLLKNNPGSQSKKIAPLKTLENYASIVAAANNIDTTGCQYKLIIAHEYFNDFNNRNMPPSKKEKMVFEGEYNYFR